MRCGCRAYWGTLRLAWREGEGAGWAARHEMQACHGGVRVGVPQAGERGPQAAQRLGQAGGDPHFSGTIRGSSQVTFREHAAGAASPFEHVDVCFTDPRSVFSLMSR